MRYITVLSLILVLCLMTLGVFCNARAQVEGQNVGTFLDSKMPGVEIKVNATSQTDPSGNITVWLIVLPQSNVTVEELKLEITGFLNGTVPEMIPKISDKYSTSDALISDEATFHVPQNVWGATFGEVTLSYNMTYGTPIGGGYLVFPNVTCGFYMTQIVNLYQEDLENQVQNMNSSYARLNETYNNLTSVYEQLNQTYLSLQLNYTGLQSGLNELDNTRRVAVILGITAVFFVVTTVFMVMRRPKETW